MSEQLPIPDPANSPQPAPREAQRIALDSSALPRPPEYGDGPDARRAGGYHGYGPGVPYAGQGPYGAGGPPPGEEAHLLDYVRVLYKRRWVALTAFVLIFGSVTLYTFTATPLYEARAQVLIENEEANVVTFEQVVEENRQTADYYQTQYRILQSRALARRTLDRMKLWDHPLWDPSKQSPGMMAAAMDWVRGLWTSASADTGEERAADETEAQSRVIDAYLERLRVTPVRNSRLVDVSFVSPDAQLSARIANEHAAAYIDQNLEFKFLASKEAADWLAARMKEQREAVEEERGGAAALPRADRCRRARGPAEHRHSAADRVERRGDAGARTERIEKEASTTRCATSDCGWRGWLLPFDVVAPMPRMTGTDAQATADIAFDVDLLSSGIASQR